MTARALFLVVGICSAALGAGRGWTGAAARASEPGKGGSGKVFYVDARSGDDRNDGSAPGRSFRTISRAVRLNGPVRPGDSVLIRGGIYRESVEIRLKGRPDAPILIAPYGDGEVIIDASPPLPDWSRHAGPVFRTSWPGKHEPVALVVDDVPIYPAASAGGDKELVARQLAENQWFYDPEEKALYLHPRGGASPRGHDVVAVENRVTGHSAIFLNHADYVTVHGLTLRGAENKGVTILGDHNRIERCRVRFTGNSGIGLFAYGGSLCVGNEIVENEVYHTMLSNWPRGRKGYKWGGWGKGIDSMKVSGTVIRGNIVFRNGGEGIGIGGSDGGSIESNTVYDNWSVNIYSNRNTNTGIRGNLCYVTAPAPGDLANNGDPSPEDGRNLRRLRAEGIMTADESSPPRARGTVIADNLIINCRRGITHYAHAAGSGFKDVTIANNTIILPHADPGQVKDSFSGIALGHFKGNNSNTTVRNNIVYGSHPATKLLEWKTPLPLPPDAGIALDRNCFFHAGSAKPFLIGGKQCSFEDWRNFSGQDAHSIYQDPLFRRFSRDPRQGDFRLSKQSRAAGTGVSKWGYAGFTGWPP